MTSSSGSSSRSRSRSRDRERKFKQILASYIEPIKEKIGKLEEPKVKAKEAEPTPEAEPVPKEMQTQMQEVQLKSLSFKSPGERSQYRLLASFKIKMDIASEKLQDAMLAHSSPDEALYEELSCIKKSIAGMAGEAVNRIVLIQQADRDPLGFRP